MLQIPEAHELPGGFNSKGWLECKDALTTA